MEDASRFIDTLTRVLGLTPHPRPAEDVWITCGASASCRER